MIHHLVLCRFRDDVSLEERTEIWAGLEGLKDVVPGLLSLDIGANISPEGLSRGYTHGFVVTFRDADARDAYLVHPAHKRAGARLVAALDGGLKGLCVVDI